MTAGQVEEVELARNAQYRVAGLDVGIITVKPDQADPAVLLAVRDPATDQVQQVVLRPGTPVTVLGCRLEAVDIQHQPKVRVRLRAGG